MYDKHHNLIYCDSTENTGSVQIILNEIFSEISAMGNDHSVVKRNENGRTDGNRQLIICRNTDMLLFSAGKRGWITS